MYGEWPRSCPPHRFECGACVVEGRDAGGGKAIVAAGAAAASGVSPVKARGEQAFGLKAVQRGVDGACGDAAAALDGVGRAKDRTAIRLVLEAEDSEQNDLFKGDRASKINDALGRKPRCAVKSEFSGDAR